MPRWSRPSSTGPPHIAGFAALANRGFPSRDLRYAADLFSGIPALGADAVQEAIVAAFNTWPDVGILRFQEDVPADIFIRFARGDHGDGDPFDGRPSSGPNVLGHASSPITTACPATSTSMARRKARGGALRGTPNFPSLHPV